MTDQISENLILKADFSNNLFLILKDGLEFTHKLFDSLSREDRVLLTEKLKEINQIIADFENKNSKNNKNN